MEGTRLRLAQESRVVYGLRGEDPHQPQSIDRDQALSAMDAPIFIPAGSMIRMDITDTQCVVLERCILRERFYHAF